MAQPYKHGEFCTYLQRYKVEKKSEFTHTSIIKPSGAFYIPTEEMDLFYSQYERAMTAGEDLYMTEKHRDTSPILIDLDFRFNKNDDLTRVYTSESIKTIILLYIKAIQKYVDLPSTGFDIYLMEKPYPTVDKGLLKDGIHIVIPDLVTKPAVQYLVREAVIPEFREYFENLQCINATEDIVDEAVIERNNWQMYGSKKPNCEPYKITKIYRYSDSDSGLSEIESRGDNHAAYVQLLSIRNKYEACPLKVETSDIVKEYERQLLAKKKAKMQQFTQNAKNTRQNTIEHRDNVEKLIDILSPQRANSYQDWMRVGWCLRNIDHRLLDKWIDFSKKSSKYKDGECERLWNYMRDDGLSVGSLHLWAKQDNPEAYKEVMKEDIRKLIYTSRNEAHFDVARVVHFMYKHMYVCASIKQNGWYEFCDHKWKECPSAHSLSTKISTDVFRQFSGAAAYYNTRAAETEDEAEQSRCAEAAKKLTEVSMKLKQHPWKENVLAECRLLFYVEKFDEKLDSKCHLIGFENGVYDLEAQEFRDGCPEDMISNTTKINYIPFEPQHPHAQAVTRFLSQVITKEHIREYVMLLLASFLNGNIREEKFHIWTGSGCFALGTQVLMYDGSKKAIEDIQVNDQLMGDDSTPRTVQQLFRGYSDMYDIIPKQGEKFTVNGQHDLVVMASNMKCIRQVGVKYAATWAEYDATRPVPIVICQGVFDTEEHINAHLDTVNAVKEGDILILTVHQYLRMSSSIKRRLNLYRPSMVHYPSKPVTIDPWTLGYQLGNDFLKSIPNEYLINDQDTRMNLLAGILDADGCYQEDNHQFYLVSKNENLLDDIIILAHSLGFTCKKRVVASGYEVCIFGQGIENIPVRTMTHINTKQNSSSNPLIVGFTVERVDDGNFYGFELDGNRRFLLAGDLFVTKNSNGKSKLIDLFEQSFGDYCCKFPVTMLTQKRAAANSATSELAKSKGKRFAVLQEPSEDEKLNVGLMKELSGGDKIQARALFKDPIEFKPQFKMVLTCNHLPNVPSDDGGTWRRIRLVEFTSKFTSDPDASNPNEFPIDMDLSNKFPDWCEHFMALLIEYYGKYCDIGIKEPEEVLKCTKEYQRMNDYYMDYVEGELEKHTESFLMVNDAYSVFKTWAKDNLPNIKFKKNDFSKAMDKIFGKRSNMNRVEGWHGYRVKTFMTGDGFMLNEEHDALG
jgi:P4 family phage/plasmid primase-like protien